MNGWNWTLHAKCSTCGASAEHEGSAEHVRRETGRWLEEHERHEYEIRQRIAKPEAEDGAGSIPDFMPGRVVPIGASS